MGLAPFTGAATPFWKHLSTAKGDLPLPWQATEQTAVVVGDMDRDGISDFVVAARKVAPALVWYRRTAKGWDRFVIEPEMLRVEAGGAVHDIDGDGDIDLLFGGDSQSDEMWWWENPWPKFGADVAWKRHLVKKGGARQHHDQVFADVLGTGQAQLIYWNQKAKTLFLAEVPARPREVDNWPATAIFIGGAEPAGGYQTLEGLDAADVDGDGKVDLLAGSHWFKHRGGMKFDAIRVAPIGGRILAGRFKPGKVAQVVISSGDGNGPLRWFECTGNPENPADWRGHTLLERDLIHAHTLQVVDIDGDGHLDIFTAEMAKWGREAAPENPGATAWICYGDGQGRFRATEFQKGMGFHEARVADLDGDGRMDVLSKPYTWEAPRIDVWLQQTAPPVRITETEYEGRAQLKVETYGATWYYDCAGGGFSRLIDADGRDWIAFHHRALKENPAGAAAGFRGMPNLLYGKDNPDAGAGHPGFDLCESLVVGADTIRTTTKSGRWAWTWRFAGVRATLTVEQTDGDRPWWFLYEGPIAGRWAPREQYWGTNLGGPRFEAPDHAKREDIVGQWRWAYFGDRTSPRVLFVEHVGGDEVADVFSYMGSTREGLAAPDGMVVFGFGRTGAKPLLRGAGARFVVGFVEAAVTDAAAHARVASIIAAAQPAGRTP